MPEFEHSRNADGELMIKNAYGSALVSRTPDVGVAGVRPWTLHINDQFHDTYDTESDAISAAHEILALRL